MKLLPILFALLLSSPALAQGYVCAEGGGNAGKGAWADEVFGWMVEKGKKGPAVIIGAISLDAEDLPDNREALFKKLGAKSCTSLVINEKNADSQEVYDTITAASIVFIRGGAQERYVNWWKGKKTEKAIRAVFDKGGVIAGTSAGCAVLGEVTYDSKNGSLKPTEALQDTRHKNLTLTTDFLGLVPGVLFDTHFTERGRIARLPVMLAQIRDDLHKDLVGIGMDPRTALCVEPDGTATVRGEGTATFLELTPGSRTEIEAGKPPVITSMSYTRVPTKARYNLKTRAFIGADDAATPIAAPSGFPEAIFDGASEKGVVPAKFNPAEKPAADDETTPRSGPVPKWQDVPQPTHLCIASNTWSKPQPVMQDVRDRVCDGWCAVLLDPGNKASLSSTGILTITTGSSPARAVVVIDPRTVRRQLPLEKATLDARMHILPPGWSIDLKTGEVMRPTPAKPDQKPPSPQPASGKP